MGLSLLAGASGSGKTTLISSWSVAFRDNQPIFGHQPRPVPFVGVLVVDRSWESHAQWFATAGWPDIPHYSYQDDHTLAWDRFLTRTELPKLFLEGLQKLAPEGHTAPPRGSVVFVDTATLFVDGNLIDYKRAAISLGHLNRTCRRLGICAIGTAHMAKQKADAKDKYQRPQDRILGSAALLGFTDTQMFILAPDDTGEDFYTFGWVPHHAPAEVFELDRNPQTGLFVARDTDRNQKELQLAQILDKILQSGTHTSDLIETGAIQWRMSRATVYRLLKELQQRGAIAPGPERGMVHRLLPA